MRNLSSEYKGEHERKKGLLSVLKISRHQGFVKCVKDVKTSMVLLSVLKTSRHQCCVWARIATTGKESALKL